MDNRQIFATFVGESSSDMAAEMEAVTASDMNKMLKCSLSVTFSE